MRDSSCFRSALARDVLATVAILLVAAPALAGLVLVDSGGGTGRAGEGGQRFVLRLDPAGFQPAAPSPAEIDAFFAPGPDETDPRELGLGLDPPDPGAMTRWTSALLAVPGLEPADLDQWRSGHPGVTLNHVVFGRAAGIRVTVDRDAVPDGAEFHVTGPAPGRARDANMAKPADAVAGRMYATGFLNPGDVRVPSRTARGGAGLPPGLAPGGAYRIGTRVVDQTTRMDRPAGVLSVPLSSVGLTSATLASARITYDGQPVAAAVGNGGSALLLYAPRTQAATNESESFFVTPGDANPSPAMAERAAFDTLAPMGTEVPVTRSQRWEPQFYYERDAPLPAGHRVVAWQLRSNATRTASIDLDIATALTTTTVALRAGLVGLNQNLSVAPDHFADVDVNGSAVPRTVWEGRTLATAEGEVELPTLPGPGDPLTVTHTVPNDTDLDGGVDIQNLDWIELSWTGNPRLDAGGVARLGVEPSVAPRRLTIGGFAAGTSATDVMLLDVTDPLRPVRIVGMPVFADGDGGVAIEFEAPAGAARFHASAVTLAEAPDYAGPAEVFPDYPTGGLEAVYVRPDAFAADVAPLVALRGPGAVGLHPQAAYNALSGGRESAQALRDALALYIANAPAAVDFPDIILVGAGSLDIKGHSRWDPGYVIPTFVATRPDADNREFSTDYFYSLLSGEDGLADAFVARIPARNASQAAVAAARHVAHAALADTLRAQPRTGLVVTDHTRPEYANFGQDAAVWTALWEETGRPSHHIDVFSANPYRAQIGDALAGPDGGVAFAFYVGHGNFDIWTGSRVVDTNTVLGSYVTEDQWPVVASLTCSNGLYAHPRLEATRQSLSEAWLFAPIEGGAVANLTTSAAELYSNLVPYCRHMLEQLAPNPQGRAERVGEVFLRPQVHFILTFPHLDYTAWGYHLFGDPSANLTLDAAQAGVARWDEFEE